MILYMDGMEHEEKAASHETPKNHEQGQAGT
jgi:hypothetical protein